MRSRRRRSSAWTTVILPARRSARTCRGRARAGGPAGAPRPGTAPRPAGHRDRTAAATAAVLFVLGRGRDAAHRLGRGPGRGGLAGAVGGRLAARVLGGALGVAALLLLGERQRSSSVLRLASLSMALSSSSSRRRRTRARAARPAPARLGGARTPLPRRRSALAAACRRASSSRSAPCRARCARLALGLRELGRPACRPPPPPPRALRPGWPSAARRAAAPPSARPCGAAALALDLDRHRLGAAVAEALAHLARHRPASASVELGLRDAQRQRLAILFLAIRHIVQRDPPLSLHSAVRRGVRCLVDHATSSRSVGSTTNSVQPRRFGDQPLGQAAATPSQHAPRGRGRRPARAASAVRTIATSGTGRTAAASAPACAARPPRRRERPSSTRRRGPRRSHARTFSISGRPPVRRGVPARADRCSSAQAAPRPGRPDRRGTVTGARAALANSALVPRPVAAPRARRSTTCPGPGSRSASRARPRRPGRPRSGSAPPSAARLAVDDAAAQRSGLGSSRLRGIGLPSSAVNRLRRAPPQALRCAVLALEPMGARRHDHVVGVVGRSRASAPTISTSSSPARSARSSSVFTPFSPSATSIAGVSPSMRRHLVGDAELHALLGQRSVSLREPGAARARCSSLGHVLVEAFDRRQLLERHVGDLLDRGEAFGHQQLGDHVVHVQRLHEHLRAAAGTPPGGARSPRPRSGCRCPSRSAARRGARSGRGGRSRGDSWSSGTTTSMRPGLLVQHDLGDLGRGQRVDDEGRGLRRPGDDVDLLALQLLHHGLDAAAAHADAGADRIDASCRGRSPRSWRGCRDRGPPP